MAASLTIFMRSPSFELAEASEKLRSRALRSVVMVMTVAAILTAIVAWANVRSGTDASVATFTAGAALGAVVFGILAQDRLTPTEVDRAVAFSDAEDRIAKLDLWATALTVRNAPRPLDLLTPMQVRSIDNEIAVRKLRLRCIRGCVRRALALGASSLIYIAIIIGVTGSTRDGTSLDLHHWRMLALLIIVLPGAVVFYSLATM